MLRKVGCMYNSVSWRWVKIATSITDSFFTSSSVSQLTFGLALVQVLVVLHTVHAWLFLSAPHTTGFLVTNMKHVHYPQSLPLRPSFWANKTWTKSLSTHPTLQENQTPCALQTSDNWAFTGFDLKREMRTKVSPTILGSVPAFIHRTNTTQRAPDLFPLFCSKLLFSAPDNHIVSLFACCFQTKRWSMLMIS